jgi:hypothetical protein
MPKVDIDYSNTLFYKISCKDVAITDVYIGHTTNFVQRKSGHKQSCNNPKSANHNFKLYSVIREHGGWDNWQMVIIAYHQCNDHYEARKIEQEYFISHNATLNSIEPMPKPKCMANPIVAATLSDVKSKHLCDICNFSCFNTLDAFNLHLTRNRHIMAVNKLNKRSANNNCKYSCEDCNYATNNKKDYNKHNLTVKHSRMQDECNDMQQPQMHSCSTCGNKYKYHSGLWKHKHKCSDNVVSTEVEQQPLPQLSDSPIAELLYQIKELKDVVSEQSKQIANQQFQTQLLLETIKDFICKP